MIKRLALVLGFFVFMLVCTLAAMRIIQVASAIAGCMLAGVEAFSGHYEWAVIVGSYLLITFILKVIAAKAAFEQKEFDDPQFLLLKSLQIAFAATAWIQAGREAASGHFEWAVIVIVYTVTSLVQWVVASDYPEDA